MLIGAGDLLAWLYLDTVTRQLASLADTLVRVCLEAASAEWAIPTDGFAVLALGKLGGQELNYSSDIDLLFLSATDAPAFRRLGERLIEKLTTVTAEGFLYRVDMRLRPWGQVGPLVTPCEAYLIYLERYARLWEKQALLKARPIAGDLALGEAFLRRAEPFIFGVSPETVRAGVHAMKQRTEAHLRRLGREWGDVKLGEGSIRDVEFVVQCLQLMHGGTHPQIRSRNTLDALERLAMHGLLTPEEHRVLADGYIFLRTIEHHLQLMDYRQTHTLPAEPQALTQLARRLGFQGPDVGAKFVTRYEQHRAAIRAVYLHHLEEGEMNQPQFPERPVVQEHVARMAPSYVNAFSEQEIAHHALLAEHLDSEHLVEVEALPLGDRRWRVTIVAYDYPGELSLICGLLFAHGLSILDGNVFTYEPETGPHLPPSLPLSSPNFGKGRGAGGDSEGSSPRKIVDVFTVQPVRGEMTQESWARYAADLAALLRLMEAGERRRARGELARRVAAAVHEMAGTAVTPLYPIEIEIDNETSDRYTVLYIDALDTPGFLYELTNALAYSRIYIARVVVNSVGHHVRDILYVTDAEGHKIADPEKQQELRAATVLIKHFTHLLPLSPNPEAALLHFREFIGELFRRQNWPAEFASLERPEVLDALARLLGVSEFLWDDFLRMQYANLFPVVRDVDTLATAKSRAELQAELESLLPVGRFDKPTYEWREVLNAFKNREMFRIDMRHILGHTQEFWEFAEELTDLAEVVVNAAYHLCHEELRAVYGTPRLAGGAISQMAVCALGKCGGREMGFASDVELMFIYDGDGETDGPRVITNAEFYERLVQTFVGAIQARREGIFEIDLQLRPYGSAGSVAVPLESFRRYFAPDGPAWAYERQALVKLRPIAGDEELGQQVARLRDEFIYTGQPFDVAAMRAMSERQVRHLVAGGTFNAKFSPGGLADLEYLVQALQIAHGHRIPALRQTNTRQALAALAEAGILSPEDYTRLRKAHTFLRWLIDGLRMVRGNARDLTVPPYDSDEFAFLARRLRYGNDVARFREDLARYTAAVQELSARLLG
jgi:glutamate-ammonia-ligase adenylyltransferase